MEFRMRSSLRNNYSSWPSSTPKTRPVALHLSGSNLQLLMGTRAHTHGGLMCATIGGMRSSRGGNLMSTNGGMRSSRGGLMSANGAMRSSNKRKKEVVQFYDFWYYSSKKIRSIGFYDIEFWFPLLKEPGTKSQFWTVTQESFFMSYRARVMV